MYSNDSFFTLGLLDGAGLLVVTGGLVWGVLALTRRVCRGPWWRRLVLVVVLFWLFLWLSPQVYYAYYQFIFNGLPIQLVIGWPPGAEAVLRRLTFSGPSTLAMHGQGVLGWLMIVTALRRKPLGLGFL